MFVFPLKLLLSTFNFSVSCRAAFIGQLCHKVGFDNFGVRHFLIETSQTHRFELFSADSFLFLRVSNVNISFYTAHHLVQRAEIGAVNCEFGVRVRAQLHHIVALNVVAEVAPCSTQPVGDAKDGVAASLRAHSSVLLLSLELILSYKVVFFQTLDHFSRLSFPPIR